MTTKEIIRDAHECPYCLSKPKTLLQALRAQKRYWFCSEFCLRMSGGDLYGLLGGPRETTEPASEAEDV